MSNYENGPEEIERIPRMPDAVLECIIEHSLFKYLANRYEGEDRDRLHGLMHDTAEEVLARVSIATPSSANGAEGLPELPPFNVTYADHSYPAYNKAAMQAYAHAAVLAERDAILNLVLSKAYNAAHLDDAKAESAYSNIASAIRARK